MLTVLDKRSAEREGSVCLTEVARSGGVQERVRRGSGALILILVEVARIQPHAQHPCPNTLTL
eukprot:2271343-Pyramimonas_sp.AAC.1